MKGNPKKKPAIDSISDQQKTPIKKTAKSNSKKTAQKDSSNTEPESKKATPKKRSTKKIALADTLIETTLPAGKELTTEVLPVEASPKRLAEQNTRYEDLNFVDTNKPVWNYSILFDDDIAYFQAGSNYALYKKFGSKKIMF